ncbi:MAG TPA: hypothetical protein VGC07_09260 [Granulicella sp.]
MMMRTGKLAVAVFAVALAACAPAWADTCTTQSQMTAADRSALASVASDLAAKIQAGDSAGIHAESVAEIAKDFAAVSDVVTSTAPKLKGGAAAVEAVYLLDGSTMKPAADGSPADAQFFCTLNRSSADVDFLIPSLPAGKYGFAIVEFPGTAAPWRLSFLLRSDQGRWLMAGLYPRPTTAAGHDGLWYWQQARKLSEEKEPWNAWLYYRQAQALLLPADFVRSTHSEKLETEIVSAAPPALSDGISTGKPLVVRAKDGKEYRFTGLGVDDSLNAASIDIAAHLQSGPLADQAAIRQQNIAAMSALLGAYPELRKAFHGVWVFSDVEGQGSYPTEQAMSDIP